MFSAATLLVLACASAIAFNLDQPANKCRPAHIGTSQNGFPVHLQSVPLNPFTLNYKVDIPTVPRCIYGETGVYASVCDTDVLPKAIFRDYNTLLVYRHGTGEFTGSVDVTVYCKRSF